jgi:hypothetical protein
VVALLAINFDIEKIEEYFKKANKNELKMG